ncbi:unnamed protein product [Phyllotreta striolata]|uniref:DUF4706 domain-containing protein n=1 Tax=Phyllotreta striolata TaxID=444603 RepID=A0A9N9XJA2_PHYSR|nr:unnamed protein product [Phyllotreta striolata]
MSLKSEAEIYFKNLNSISARLCQDLEDVKTSYEDLWETIPEKEQQAILTESVIKPEVIIKYNSFVEKSKDDNFAAKLVFDENCSYRDEHSGPFSFKTQSQRDLSILCSKKPEKSTENRIKMPVVKPKVPPPPKPVLLYKAPEEERILDILDTDSTNSLLPKTGLDFLDNW